MGEREQRAEEYVWKGGGLQNAEKNPYKTPKKILTKRRKKSLQNAEKNPCKTPKKNRRILKISLAFVEKCGIIKL